MKKNLYNLIQIMFIALFPAYSWAQFAPVGAEWYYSDTEGDISIAYKRYISEKDTVVNDKTCKVVNGTYSLDKNFSQREIMYEENGKIYYFFNEKFRKIYDFGLQKGDVVDFEFKGYSLESSLTDTTYIVNFKIENIETVKIDGKDIKKFTATATKQQQDSIKGESYVYYEKIGCPQEFIRTRYFHTFFQNKNVIRCYNDNDIHYISDEWSPYKDKPCDYIYTPSALEPVIDSTKIIPANPTVKDEVKFAITITEAFSGNCTYKMEVDSIIGQTIYVGGKIDSNNKCGDYQNIEVKDTINVGLLPNSGSYQLVYNLTDENKVLTAQKITMDFELKSSQFDASKTNLNTTEFFYDKNAKSLVIETISTSSVSVSLYNIMGKAAYPAKKTIEDNRIVLDLSNINPGVYIVVLRDEFGNNFSGKFIMF